MLVMDHIRLGAFVHSAFGFGLLFSSIHSILSLAHDVPA
jgi:hypothetical protein